MLGALVGLCLLAGCARLIKVVQRSMLRHSVRSQVLGHVPQTGDDTELGAILEKVRVLQASLLLGGSTSCAGVAAGGAVA